MSQPPCPVKGLSLGLICALFAFSGVLAGGKQDKGGKTFGRPHIDAVTGEVKELSSARVIDFGKVIYEGKVDVNPTLKRIRSGKALEHRNDGAIFLNKEGRLPRHKDRDYYREFVHPIKGVKLPGPCRVVIGKKGEVYWTGDHYKTFTRVR
jgi:hypothetical protein